MRIREWILRLLGTLGGRRPDPDLEEELRAHLELAAEAEGGGSERAGQALRDVRLRAGGVAQAMDAIRDQRGLPWLEALGADVVFASRQLRKHRTVTVAAVLSLGLSIGATTAAFQLIDAVLVRPLPVAEPGRLYSLAWNSTTSRNEVEYRESFDYPSFRRYSDVTAGKARLMVVGIAAPLQVIVGNGTETELVHRQYFSGNVFPTFGRQAALGRLLTPDDDRTPGAHPVVVISYDYWANRFARDPRVLGQTIRIADQPFEIVGVAPAGFTGTEPGEMTDLFVPASMNVRGLTNANNSWFRLWVRPDDGQSIAQVHAMLQAEFAREHRDNLTRFSATYPKERINAYLNERLLIAPAASGVSDLQRTLRRPLYVLAALVLLLLLIACANVANLLAARGLARAREMALRLSLGAGQLRLVQLVLVESALLAMSASAVGAVFARWAVPFVVALLAMPDEPVRLSLGADWRLLAFGFGLTVAVTAIFGLSPALRASATTPSQNLAGFEDRHARQRLTRSLIGAQIAFCLFVVFAAGLFVATFTKLSNRPLGFAPQHIHLLTAQLREQQSPAGWIDITDRLRRVPGIADAAVASWPPLSGNRSTTTVRVDGQRPDDFFSYVLAVSTGYFDTMRIGLVGGRDFTTTDRPPKVFQDKPAQAGVGIVNEAFARRYFDGRGPVGRRIGIFPEAGMEIVGVVRDAAYYDVREVMRPTIYVPLDETNFGTLIVRASGDLITPASTLQHAVSEVRPGARVASLGALDARVRRQMIRERLLAILSLFFAGVAVLLAGVGLYGVLNYAVVQQRREIGIRVALGARAAQVIKRVTAEMLGSIAVGSAVGLTAGIAVERLVESLLFEVRSTDPSSWSLPILTMAATATLAALPPVARAIRIDPAQTLRSE